MSELSGFVYIKSHLKLHVKSKAQKVTPKTICAPVLPETPLCFEKGEGGGGGEKEFEIYREGLGKALKELSNVCVSIFSPLERSANFITNTFSFAFHTISFIFLLTLAEKMISRHRLAFSKLMARSKSTVITPFLYICDQKRKDSFD